MSPSHPQHLPLQLPRSPIWDMGPLVSLGSVPGQAWAPGVLPLVTFKHV